MTESLLRPLFPFIFPLLALWIIKSRKFNLANNGERAGEQKVFPGHAETHKNTLRNLFLHKRVFCLLYKPKVSVEYLSF